MNKRDSHIALSVSNKEIWNISYPIIFGNLAQTMIVLVNTIFLGHLGNAELGAAMMAGLYYLIFTTVTQGFAVGIQILVARRLGEGKLQQIGKIFEHGLYFTLILGVIMLFILHTWADDIFRHVIKSPNIYTAAVQFMDFRQWGIVFVSVNFLFRSLYIGLSNTKIITFTTLLMAVINITFDYGLIFGNLGLPKMGVAGAGLSSVLAEGAATLVFFGYTLFKLPYKKYCLFQFQAVEWPLFGKILKIALPTMFQRLISFGSWFLFFIMIEHLGEREIAISGIVRSVYMLCTIPVFAFSATANTLTSRLIGANKQDEITGTLRRIVKMSLCTLLPILLIFTIFPKKIVSIYTDDMLLAAQAVPTLYVIYIGAIMMAFSMVYFEFISGTGRTFIALVLETFVLCFYILYIFIATQKFHFAIQWVWCTEWIYSGLVLIFSVAYLKFAPWKKPFSKLK